jgi:hypothetical protein
VKPGNAALGFTIKSGWTCAVLLTGPVSSPAVVASQRVELSDPAVPEARQPYHDGFGTARRSGPALKRLLTSIERFGHRSVTSAIRKYAEEGHRLAGAGIVVGSTTDPDTIANPHIRIHALEGFAGSSRARSPPNECRVPCGATAMYTALPRRFSSARNRTFAAP